MKPMCAICGCECEAERRVDVRVSSPEGLVRYALPVCDAHAAAIAVGMQTVAHPADEEDTDTREEARVVAMGLFIEQCVRDGREDLIPPGEFIPPRWALPPVDQEDTDGR